MNISIIFGSLGVYALNQLYIKKVVSISFFHYYFNDVIAGLLLISVANLLIEISPHRQNTFKTAISIYTLTLFAGIFWEYVAPFYRGGTSDPFDLVAYIAGATIYLVTVKSRTRCCTQRLPASRLVLGRFAPGTSRATGSRG